MLHQWQKDVGAKMMAPNPDYKQGMEPWTGAKYEVGTKQGQITNYESQIRHMFNRRGLFASRYFLYNNHVLLGPPGAIPKSLRAKHGAIELFYWDYVIGILLLSFIFAFTLGSNGEAGRPFLEDLKQAETSSITSAFIGGIIFNAANILLSTAIAIAGMSVAFPVGIGIALVLGVIVNYAGSAKGNPTLLFAG